MTRNESVPSAPTVALARRIRAVLAAAAAIAMSAGAGPMDAPVLARAATGLLATPLMATGLLATPLPPSSHPASATNTAKPDSKPPVPAPAPAPSKSAAPSGQRTGTKTLKIDSPAAHIQRARDFSKAGNYAAAEQELVAADKVTPNFSLILQELSNVQFHQGKVDAALASLERAIRSGTSFDDRAYLLAARIFSGKKMYDEGIKKLIEWGGNRQVTPNFHSAIGILKLSAYELGPAELELREALKVDPGNEAALTAMSQLYGKLDKYPRLQPFLDKGLAAKPNSIPVLMLNGNSLLRQDRYAEAKERFETVIKLDPSNADAYVNRGSALHALGDVPGAMRDFQKGAELAPQKIEGPINLALALERESKFAQARDVLLAARERMPANLDVMNALAMAYHLNHEMDPALEAIRESLRRDPDQPAMKSLLERVMAEKAAGPGAQPVPTVKPR